LADIIESEMNQVHFVFSCFKSSFHMAEGAVIMSIKFDHSLFYVSLLVPYASFFSLIRISPLCFLGLCLDMLSLFSLRSIDLSSRPELPSG
jgi:hypothetical protein